jgi:arylsulfatase
MAHTGVREKERRFPGEPEVKFIIPVLPSKAGLVGLARSIVLILVAALVASPPTAQAQQQKPNIVLIFMDQFGFGELGVYGGGILRGAPTPRIDKLAAEGMMLLNFNAEMICTPSRSALLTGRAPMRTGTHFVGWQGVDSGLAHYEKTLAELLSEQGYATAVFGKWHLGEGPKRSPGFHGFDEAYFIANSPDEAL